MTRAGRAERRQGSRRVGIGSAVRMAALLAVCLVVSASIAGCKGKETQKSSQTVAARSVVVVNVTAAEIAVKPQTAEFRIAPTGALTASLLGSVGTSSLDGTAPELSPVISISKKLHSNVTFDLGKAEVRDAAGKLGAVGKHTEVTGKIPGSELTETLSVEIYDDFPGVALVSLGIRNTGLKDLSLDWISLQRHHFSAANGSKNGAPTLWTFQGASLKWGKDEIFAMPAKFSQENPFGAAVPTKDDLVAVGGGIPVVAFWSRDVGEAIGHVETLPLTLSIPVHAIPSGGVEASVQIPANVILKAGETFFTPRTFLTIFQGDFYQPLNLWSNVVEKEGLERPHNNDSNSAL